MSDLSNQKLDECAGGDAGGGEGRGRGSYWYANPLDEYERCVCDVTHRKVRCRERYRERQRERRSERQREREGERRTGQGET